MKTIGIIGGMSWESTIEYYRIINTLVNERLKKLHSASMLIESYDFDEIEKLQSEGAWDKLEKILTDSARKLEKAGADYIAIATNTMHLVAPEVQNNISIPLIHIARAAGNYIKKNGLDTAALFGTKYTMTKPFYKDILTKEYNIKVVLPEDSEQNTINNIIYNELCKGIINETSRKVLSGIISNCAKKGAKAVVLGCTELPNIIREADVPIINTTEIHCLEIVNTILA